MKKDFFFSEGGTNGLFACMLAACQSSFYIDPAEDICGMPKEGSSGERSFGEKAVSFATPVCRSLIV
jgi:hypothetical protein